MLFDKNSNLVAKIVAAEKHGYVSRVRPLTQETTAACLKSPDTEKPGIETSFFSFFELKFVRMARGGGVELVLHYVFLTARQSQERFADGKVHRRVGPVRMACVRAARPHKDTRRGCRVSV